MYILYQKQSRRQTEKRYKETQCYCFYFVFVYLFFCFRRHTHTQKNSWSGEKSGSVGLPKTNVFLGKNTQKKNVSGDLTDSSFTADLNMIDTFFGFRCQILQQIVYLLSLCVFPVNLRIFSVCFEYIDCLFNNFDAVFYESTIFTSMIS